MSTKIRLMRMGSMKRPFYRMVVVDSRKRRDGRYLENLGTYNPIPKVAEVNLKEDRIIHWLQLGAQMTGTPESLCRNAGILEKFNLLKAGVAPEEIEAKLEEIRAKQPRSAAATLTRTEKKAKKKTDARAEAEAEIQAKAEEEAKEKAAEEAKAKAEAAAKAKEEAAAKAKAAKEAEVKEETAAAEESAEEAPADDSTEA